MEPESRGSFKLAFITLFLLIILSVLIFAQWTQEVSGTQYPLHSVYFFNSTTGLLSSNSDMFSQFLGGEIIRTTNSGNNWQRVLLDSNFRPKGFYFFDNNTGFAVGGRYATLGNIYKSTNGGLNWLDVTPDSLNTHLTNLVFVNNLTGYAGAVHGIIKTTDAGNSWTRILSVIPADYVPTAKVIFLNENIGFYVRDTGSVYKTLNAGTNWQLTQLTVPPYFNYFRDIKFIDMNTGFIVGNGAIIFKTTNQGTNWTRQSFPVSQNLYSIFFANSNTGYITAEHTVLKTTNSGSIWFSVFSYPADTLFSSFFLNENTGYVCGDEGRVYKTTTGGVIGINNIGGTVPKEFLLYQNYPNPFNPSTSIKFAVPKFSVVKMLLFDALGRELETLVNENLDPGTYEVSWDASKYSSGIYFYQILAGDFVSVKKMTLIK